MPKKSSIAPALPSASIILIRDGLSGLEVLMMERSKTMRFAPGALVFPGGKVDASDKRKAFWRRHVTHKSLGCDFAYKMAALRELYEETGLLYSQNIPQRFRRLAPYNQRNFIRFVQAQKIHLALNKLVYFAHWITPEAMPRRFDTRFYLAPCLNDQKPVADGLEAITVRWNNPHDLLNDHKNTSTQIMLPTRMNLMTLGQSKTVKAAISAARLSTVQSILPKNIP